MAVISIPNTSVEQPNQSESVNETGTRTFQRSFKDSYSVLKTLLDSISNGDTLDNDVVCGVNLERNPGNYGTLTFSLTEEDTSTSQGQTSQTAKLAVWSCKSVRNDVSIFAYCGSAAKRVNIELWMKEPNADLADANQYHKNESQVDTLNSQEQAIASKIKKGIESVIRFYPVLTCTSYWSRIPRTFMENLGFVNNPAAPSADEVQAPNNLSSIVSSHSWLKVQDDVSETGDGRFQRVESWMGIKNTDNSNGWDSDLYGSNRWPMPVVSAS